MTTSRKLILLESDDWGSLALRDQSTFNSLKRQGLPVESDPYCLFDNLASPNDLYALFEVLTSVKDKNGNSAKLTANAVTANPDFTRIFDSDYLNYFHVPICKGFEMMGFGNKTLQIWKEGRENGLFQPQFHGREHLNAIEWMRQLRDGNRQLLAAFKMGAFAVPLSEKIGNRSDIRAALDLQRDEDRVFHDSYLREGLEMFEAMHGFKSRTFIAPCYTWSKGDEKILKELGIDHLQGSYVQKVPQEGKRYRKIRNYSGKRNKWRQTYFVRNAFFEPSLNYHKQDVVGNCLSAISKSFKFGKPAIISCHRLNFISSRSIKNRDENLILLRALLNDVVRLWPDVEFLSSDQLLNEMERK